MNILKMKMWLEKGLRPIVTKGDPDKANSWNFSIQWHLGQDDENLP